MNEPIPDTAQARDHTGWWFADERGIERRLRVSWHPERKLFVLSVWQGDACSATFRLPLGEVPRLLGALLDGLGEAATGVIARRGGRRDSGSRPSHGPGRWRPF